MVAPGPFATIAVVSVLHLTLRPVDARSLRIATDQESKDCQPGAPVPASAPAAAPPTSPAAAAPPAPPPPADGSAPPPPPCPMQQPVLPPDALVKKIEQYGDDALTGAGAQIKSAATEAKVEALGMIKSTADGLNPSKNPREAGALEAEATGPLQKVREELKTNFDAMQAKSEKEAAEVIDKVKVSIHEATYATVDAAVKKTEEENAQLVNATLGHADKDIKYSTELADTAMNAVKTTMKAISKVQKATDSLPKDEIEKASHGGTRAQKTAVMFTKQALNTKQVVEQFMNLAYASHHDVAVADDEQSSGLHVATDAEKQASTNTADIMVLTASLKEASEEAVQANKRTADLGKIVLDMSF